MASAADVLGCAFMSAMDVGVDVSERRDAVASYSAISARLVAGQEARERVSKVVWAQAVVGDLVDDALV